MNHCASLPFYSSQNLIVKSLLHHFVSPFSGAEALVSCGLLEALLRVVEHQGGDSHLTVRINFEKCPFIYQE